MLKQITMSVLGILILSSVSLAGDHGPGGDAVRSTPDEVDTAIDSTMHWEFPDVFEEIKVDVKPNTSLWIQNARVREILTKVASLKLDYEKAVGPNKLVPTILIDKKKTEYCIDQNGEQKDASVEDSNPVKLCMSVKGLSRYPREALASQISALVVHELAHVAGYKDEKDAIAVQDFVLNTLFKDCGINIFLSGSDDEDVVSLKVRRHGSLPYYVTGQNMSVEYDALHVTQRQPQRDGHFILKTENLKSDFNLDLKAAGRVTFLTLNSDGTLSKQDVSWSNLYKADFMNYATPTGAVNSGVVIDGHHYPVRGIVFKDSCFDN